MIVKVCGITCLEDALRAVEAGANTLGFNFYERSPRYIGAEQAAEIIEGINGAPVLTVAVVVAASSGPRLSAFIRVIREPMLSSGESQTEEPGALAIPDSIHAVQLHGIARPADLPDFGRRLIVAVSAETASRFPDNEIIIDSSWGTGRVDDWSTLTRIHRPYILSGGLNPENVGRAIENLHPAGVDVCSGVESVPGRKDMQKLKAFVAEVRRVYGEF